ncbi:hypothetical protein GNI_080720 [Gregarina niphandrodes]|uniref:Uncharacterized protein n=1 Tax=Gregarina niphandrodes TaxID=110365 RepID=A0A023B6E9_GRENI|nr:hypothetical protein GNI_080720 [Gregarina niphandrodes]EZG66409.1 hypothetical protein GNI_080720 [Gregarina niphandrodes]|eukprot:XP_011134001.1 hypothetical protein GNI_080720 [Gregarina niphandrodes]
MAGCVALALNRRFWKRLTRREQE